MKVSQWILALTVLLGSGFASASSDSQLPCKQKSAARLTDTTTVKQVVTREPIKDDAREQGTK